MWCYKVVLQNGTTGFRRMQCLQYLIEREENGNESLLLRHFFSDFLQLIRIRPEKNQPRSLLKNPPEQTISKERTA